MTTQPTFVRARSAAQRAERRAAILDTAAAMLARSRVAELSLNELARQVGLAKSNVLRYFESREAVLLELLGREYDEWLDAVAVELEPDARVDRIEQIAEVVAGTAAARPLLCELLASAALVLEHNVSAEVAAEYKRGSVARAERLVRLLTAGIRLGDERSLVQLAGAVNLAVGGIWGMCRPSVGMLAAYERYPELAGFRLDFESTLREFVAVLLTGLVTREGAHGGDR